MSWLDELTWRGMVEQSTPELAASASKGESLTVYCGFDPTAPSLHLGSLIPVLGLARLQRAGHRPIAVVGGATGLIGDPSGKATERPLIGVAEVDENVAGIRAQLRRFLDFDGPRGAQVVNNYDWLGAQTFLGFLRDYGKHFRVGAMLGKESVRSRIEDRDQGMSFTEFSYMLLQAVDYLHLHSAQGCTLQVGGSDQWGNITAGIELIRRMKGSAVHGLTFPLLLTSAGAKFGKTESGALWLDPDRTRPYEIYQYFVRTDDRDVSKFLRLFTFLDRQAIDALEAEAAARPGDRAAQRTLAFEVTQLIHGASEAERCVSASQVLFGAPLDGLTEQDLLGVFADVPSLEIPLGQIEGGWSLVDALVDTGLAKSKGDARRRLDGGGVYVNNVRVDAADRVLNTGDLVTPSVLVLRMGKRSYHLVRVVR